MSISIRSINDSELHVITRLSAEIWPIVYKSIISEEQISYMLKRMYSHEVLEQNLSEGHHFLIATIDNQDVGYAGFQPHYPRLDFAKLHKLYVLPALHKTGVGSALFEQTIKKCKMAHCNHLVLQVNKTNPAFHFYQKKGMYIEEEAIIDIGNGFVMDDYIMRLDW